MISPSRRRQANAPEVGAYTLHVAAARRMALDRRVWRAAVGALGGALLGAVLSRFFELPMLAHLGFTLVAAAVGAALPVPPLARKALDTIADQTGLAYESGLIVLEREAEGGAPDEFGLADRVVEAGARSVRDYRRPPAPAWWLPVAVLAVATLGLTYAFPRRAAPSTTARTTEAGLPAEREGGEDQALERAGELAGRLEAASRAEGAAAQDQVGGGATDDRDALPPGTEAGNEALSRFLEALRQGEATPNSGAGSGASSPVGGGESAEGNQPPRTSEPNTAAAEAAPPGAGDGGGGTGSDDASDDGTPGGTQAAGARPEEQNGVTGDAGAARPPDGTAPQVADGEAPEGDRRLSEGEEAMGGGGAQLPRDDDRGGGEGGASGEGEGADEAGAVGVGGVPLDDNAEGAEPAFVTGGVELLPGVIETGPTNPAGRVRLPGTSEVELPVGTPLGPYAEAAEEAVGEGDLPAGYQEIIRRYFR
ncbi:MAG: hypothetical protein M9914_09365 [Trueperaceae bacterium]|nr:hypothetical protein [Trueperaceae bacterium]